MSRLFYRRSRISERFSARRRRSSGRSRGVHSRERDGREGDRSEIDNSADFNGAHRVGTDASFQVMWRDGRTQRGEARRDGVSRVESRSEVM